MTTYHDFIKEWGRATEQNCFRCLMPDSQKFKISTAIKTEDVFLQFEQGKMRKITVFSPFYLRNNRMTIIHLELVLHLIFAKTNCFEL